ncbi:hypothetical protein GN956_G13919 [Arapaima gigas]
MGFYRPEGFESRSGSADSQRPLSNEEQEALMLELVAVTVAETLHHCTMEEVADTDGLDHFPSSLQRTETEQERNSETILLPRDAQHTTNSSPGTRPPLSCLPCGSAQPQQPTGAGSAVSALQFKVKALSERRAAVKEREDKVLPAQGPTSGLQSPGVKKPSSLLLTAGSPPTGTWQHSSSDEDVDPLLQEPPCSSEFALQGQTDTEEEVVGGSRNEGGPHSGQSSIPRELCEEASVEKLTNGNGNCQEDPLCAKNWTHPKGTWKATRPEMLFLNGDTSLLEDRPGVRVQRKVIPAGGECIRRELQRSDSLESHLHRCVQSDEGPVAPLGGLWRADSWESVCSSGSSLSLAERVEMNRAILRQMLSESMYSRATENQMGPETEHRLEDVCDHRGKGLIALNDSDWDSGISLQDSEHCPRAFVLSDQLPLSPRHEQAKRLLERARMKARSNPLKADHTILPVPRDDPESLSRGGVPLHRTLPGKEGVAATSGNLSDSSSGDSASGFRRRHGQSPTRVRFEDESEKDAEVRYLERLRQQRRAGERAQGLLVSKPTLSSYVNGRKEDEAVRGPDTVLNTRPRRTQEEALGKSGSQSKDTSQEFLSRKCNSCGSLLDGGATAAANLQLEQTANLHHDTQGKTVPCWVAPVHPTRTVRTEWIRETYIGEVSTAKDLSTDSTHCLSACSAEKDGQPGAHTAHVQKAAGASDSGAPVSNSNTRPRANGTETSVSTGSAAVTPNTYSTDQSGQYVTMGSPCQSSASPAPQETQTQPLEELSNQPQNKESPSTPQPKKSALKSGPKNRPSGQRVVKLMPSPHFRHIHLDEPENLDPSLQQGAPETTAGHYHQGNVDQCHDPTSSSTAPRCGGDGQIRGPMRVEHLRENSPDMAHGLDSHRRFLMEGPDPREGRPKLSLRRFFSAIGLNSVGKLVKGRSSSMEQLSFTPRHSPASLSPTQRHQTPLKKAPSLQSLHVGSPLTQLRKAASVQSLQSPRRKAERCAATPLGEQPFSATCRGLQRTLSVEDVGCPSRVRSVGRVAQSFPDGTLLLELNRPSHGHFGFLISRGKGRPDSGVYVEEMGDSSTQKLYAGLLGVGDEILEVNGEKVAGLSLDQVTRLMTRDDAASVRVLRHRHLPR